LIFFNNPGGFWVSSCFSKTLNYIPFMILGQVE
jgi:hypothetical protein